MVFGWFDSTLSTKYLLTKTEKLMENEKQFITIRRNTNLSTFGCTYESFILKFISMSKIEKVEIVRLLKTDKRPGKFNNMFRQALFDNPETACLWRSGEKSLNNDEKEIYKKYLQWLKKQKRKEQMWDWSIYTPLIIIVVVILYPVLKFVGGICFVGFNLFASEGSVLGYIFGIAAVIIALGIFATLVRAILGR